MTSTAIIWGAIGGALGGVVGVFLVQFGRGFIAGVREARRRRVQEANYRAELERQTHIIEAEEEETDSGIIVNPRPMGCFDPSCGDDRPHAAHTTYAVGLECNRPDCFDTRPHARH